MRHAPFQSLEPRLLLSKLDLADNVIITNTSTTEKIYNITAVGNCSVKYVPGRNGIKAHYVIQQGKQITNLNAPLLKGFSIVGSEGDDTIALVLPEGGPILRNQVWCSLGNDYFIGIGPSRDIVNGEDGNDTLNGGGGSDTLDGGAGLDQIRGAAGNDNLSGGDNPDNLRGGNGNDKLYGNGGRDRIAGDAGDDMLDSGNGDDMLDGGDGSDSVYGGAGTNVIYGGEGNDLIWAGAGNDACDGGAGDDDLHGEDGTDLLNGGAGNDDFYPELNDASGEDNYPEQISDYDGEQDLNRNTFPTSLNRDGSYGEPIVGSITDFGGSIGGGTLTIGGVNTTGVTGGGGLVLNNGTLTVANPSTIGQLQLTDDNTTTGLTTFTGLITGIGNRLILSPT